MSAFHLPALRFIFLPLSFCLPPLGQTKKETERERQKDEDERGRRALDLRMDVSTNDGGA